MYFWLPYTFLRFLSYPELCTFSLEPTCYAEPGLRSRFQAASLKTTQKSVLLYPSSFYSWNPLPMHCYMTQYCFWPIECGSHCIHSSISAIFRNFLSLPWIVIYSTDSQIWKAIVLPIHSYTREHMPLCSCQQHSDRWFDFHMTELLQKFPFYAFGLTYLYSFMNLAERSPSNSVSNFFLENLLFPSDPSGDTQIFSKNLFFPSPTRAPL